MAHIFIEYYGSFSYLEQPNGGVSLIQTMCGHKDPVSPKVESMVSS